MMKIRNIYKKSTAKEKKEKHDNLHDNEREKFRKYEKKGKKVMHDSLWDGEIKQVR